MFSNSFNILYSSFKVLDEVKSLATQNFDRGEETIHNFLLNEIFSWTSCAMINHIAKKKKLF